MTESKVSGVRCLVSVVFSMTFNKMGTLPLPLALHLATYTVIGLFCAFAGGLNLIDPTKIFPNAVIFLGLAGFSWGYVFGILMAQRSAGPGTPSQHRLHRSGHLAAGPALGAGCVAPGDRGVRSGSARAVSPPNSRSLADHVFAGRGGWQLDHKLGPAEGRGVFQPNPAADLRHHTLTDR